MSIPNVTINLCFAILVVSFSGAGIAECQSLPIDSLPRHSLTIALGANILYSRDEMASPLLYKETGIPVEFGYRSHSAISEDAVKIVFTGSGINAPPMKTDFGSVNAKKVYFAILSVTYDHLRSVGLFDNIRWRIFLGGSLDNFLFLRSYKFYGGDFYTQEGVDSWESVNTLDVTVKTNYYLSSQDFIEAQLYVPVVGVIARPAYNFFNSNESVFSLENIHAVMFGNVIGFNYKIEYSHSFSHSIDGAVVLTSKYYHYNRYAWTTSMLSYQLTFQLDWSFS